MCRTIDGEPGRSATFLAPGAAGHRRPGRRAMAAAPGPARAWRRDRRRGRPCSCLSASISSSSSCSRRETLELDATTAIIAPNGAGKSALLDALQIVMLGGDRNQIRFNAQAGGRHAPVPSAIIALASTVPATRGARAKRHRPISAWSSRSRPPARRSPPASRLGASTQEPDHRVHGLYLLSGVALTLDDHLETSRASNAAGVGRFRELIASAARMQAARPSCTPAATASSRTCCSG